MSRPEAIPQGRATRRAGVLVLAVLALLPAAAHGREPPRLVEAVTAELATAPAEEATVVIVLDVDDEGRTRSAAVLESGGASLDEAALAASQRLRLSAGGVTATVAYHFVPGQTSAPPVLLAASHPEEVTIHEAAPAPGVIPQPVQLVVKATDAARLPGTEGDPARVVESLPGVARPTVGTGDLSIWGADPGQSRAYVDGVEVPALYHAGGWRSVLGPGMIGAVVLVPGGYGAEHGRGLGGLVDVATAPLAVDGWHGSAALDPLDASVALSHGAGPRLRIGGAARASVIDALLGSALAPDLGGLVAVPRYRDAQLKATVELSDDEDLSALALASSDALRLAVPASPGVAERSDALDTSFGRLALRYQRTHRGEPTADVVAWLGLERSARTLRAAGIPAALEQNATSFGLRAWLREPLGAWLDLTVGLDGLVASVALARAGSLTIPAREGDVTVFGQPPGSDVNADRWRVVELAAAPFVSSVMRLGPLALTLGLRLEALGVDTSRRTPRVGATPAIGSTRLGFTPDPRVSARVTLGPGLSVTASAGQYHQLPAPADLSAVFGTPLLEASEARHLTLAAELRRGDALLVQATAFLELQRGLAVRDPGAAPPLAAVLTAAGEGQNLGAQVLLRLAHRGVVAWLTYTLSRAERRASDAAPWRLADFDQTHVGSAVASARLGPWTLGARVRVASGAPRTPVIGAYEDLATGRYDPLFGAANTDRLPLFFSVDARVDRQLTLGPVTLDAYLELLNLTAHENAEERFYASDYRRSGLLTGLPLLALVGARVGF